MRILWGVRPSDCGEGEEAGVEERTASFSEVRRNLSGKAGKMGGESWPPSRLSRAHGGKILQDFFRSLPDPPIFPVFPL